jgi:hypothetical protein
MWLPSRRERTPGDDDDDRRDEEELCEQAHSLRDRTLAERSRRGVGAFARRNRHRKADRRKIG